MTALSCLAATLSPFTGVPMTFDCRESAASGAAAMYVERAKYGLSSGWPTPSLYSASTLPICADTKVAALVLQGPSALA